MENVKKFIVTILMKDGRMYYLVRGKVPAMNIEEATVFDSEAEAIDATNKCFLQKTIYPMAWVIMFKDEMKNEYSFKSITLAD